MLYFVSPGRQCPPAGRVAGLSGERWKRGLERIPYRSKQETSPTLPNRHNDKKSFQRVPLKLMGAYARWAYWTKRLPIWSTLPESSTQSDGDVTRRRAGVRLPATRVRELVAGYEAGATVYELADRFGVHRDTVSAHLHRQGVPMRRQGLNEAEVDRAVRLYIAGGSLGRVGSHLGVDAHTVRSALLKREVRMRDTQGRER